MTISGSLKDVAVADVLQFIHLGRRTGTLVLERVGERALLRFHLGRVLSARAPQTPRLGDLLVDSGKVSAEALRTAIETQSRDGEKRPLGQILIATAAIRPEELRDLVSQQVEQAVTEALTWESGTFDFAMDDLVPVDDIVIYPTDIMSDGDINTQMVLLEAARIFDEKDRGAGKEIGEDTAAVVPLDPAGPAAPAAPAVNEAPAEELAEVMRRLTHGSPKADSVPQAPTPVRIVTDDVDLATSLAGALPPELTRMSRAPLQSAAAAQGDEPSPIVILDLRGALPALEEVAKLHRAHPGAALIGLTSPGAPIAPIYAAGVVAALPADPGAIAACVGSLLESRGPMAPTIPAADTAGGVARLRRVFGDLRSGLISATVALNLMQIISESFERAILFLVKRDELAVLGAFGTGVNGRPLAEMLRGVRFVPEGGLLARALENGEVQSTEFASIGLPVRLANLICSPRNSRVVIFPVLGAQRVISLVYTDNGDHEAAVEDTDILELATAQVGIAFENELLRRQISHHGE